MQNKLNEGGINRNKLILFFAFNWDPAITNIILNVPLFFIGWKYLGRNTFYYTIIGMFRVFAFFIIFFIHPFPIYLQLDLKFVQFFYVIYFFVYQDIFI